MINKKPNNNSIYEVIEYGDMIRKYVNRLDVEESSEKNDNSNIDKYLLKKYQIQYPWKSYYSSKFNNSTNNFTNFFPSLKTKNKTKNESSYFYPNDININDLKLLSQKGFELMKTKHYNEYTKKINNVIKSIKENRKRYFSLSEKNMDIYKRR